MAKDGHRNSLPVPLVITSSLLSSERIYSLETRQVQHTATTQWQLSCTRWVQLWKCIQRYSTAHVLHSSEPLLHCSQLISLLLISWTECNSTCCTDGGQPRCHYRSLKWRCHRRKRRWGIASSGNGRNCCHWQKPYTSSSSTTLSW